MIPKIIHYSWVGAKMPVNIQKRINEWKHQLPDWKFMFWNEDNYDFSKFAFTKQKMKEHDWGYSSDELRYDVVYKYGGFYLDTDMIIKKDISEFLNNKMIWGFMYDNSLLTSFFGSEPEHPLLKQLLNEYSDPDNKKYLLVMQSNPFVTKMFIKLFPSFKLNGHKQLLSFEGHSLSVYPRDFFCFPSHNKNANYTLHLFDNSWGTRNKGLYGAMKWIGRRALPVTYGNIANKRGIKYTNQFFDN